MCEQENDAIKTNFEVFARSGCFFGFGSGATAKFQNVRFKEVIIKGSLKVKKGTVFKKKKVDVKDVDISIKKDDGTGVTKKTAAELAFEKRQRETACKRLKEKAAVSRRKHVEQFNKKMEEMSEFNEVPKISWTK